MKALHDKVNIVPVVAKADTLTKKEVKSMKERVSYNFYHWLFKEGQWLASARYLVDVFSPKLI